MSTISTSAARCRDCYKCIRHCPVKAIGLKDGQAWVSEEKCILCGQCIKICPQKAKSTVSQVEKFDQILQEKLPVIVSLAPSYLATSFFSSPWKLVAGLYDLGVVRIEETAVAAELIAQVYHKCIEIQNKETVISSCCPVIVNLIEKHYPKLHSLFPSVVSPMIAHGRQIKNGQGTEVRVVFIGPCYGKKSEATIEDSNIDLVLTFEELIEYFNTRKMDCEKLDERYPDAVSNQARSFPLQQGILKSAGIEQSLNADILSISGMDECLETFKDLEEGLIHPRFIEALACKGGCIGGPAMGSHDGAPARKERLLKNVFNLNGKISDAGRHSEVSLKRKHKPFELIQKIPSEQEIRAVLALTGKYTPEDETNCGGCGYPSCRDKAIAVCQGMAEPEMCIPYMKNKAESFSNTIVDTTLNAIIVVDQKLIVQKYNPSATQMFGFPKNETQGLQLEIYLDPDDFQKVFESQKIFVGQRSYPELKIVTRQIIYPLPKYGVVIGIISDISAEEARKAKFDKMKHEAFDRASKVIHEQMRTAQEIAGLLGESTSETKATLLELMELMEGEMEGEI